MKRIFFLLSAIFLIHAFTFAQAPQGINYQGVARNSQGAALGMQTISVQITIMHSGTPVYQEHQTLQTDTFGLYSLVIGSTSAVVTQGTFASIPWSAGNQSVQIDIDPNGGSAYTPVSTMALQSVPYALYAASAGGSSNGTVTSITAGAGLTATANPITSSGTIDLPTFAGVAGPWGSATSIPTFTVDAYGRITSISSMPLATSSTSINVNGGGITSASTVNAYTLTVDNTAPIWNAGSILSTPVTVAGLANGDILKYNGTNWINTPSSLLPAGTGGEMLYNLGGAWTASNVNKLTFTPGNFMGINNASPAGFLHVTSTTSATALIADNATGTGPAIESNGLLRVNGPLQLGGDLRDAVNLSGNNGDILISQGAGVAPKWQPASSIPQPWTLSGNNVYTTNSANLVGIGTSFPSGMLTITNAGGGTTDALTINNNGSGYGINIMNNYSSGGSPMLRIFHQDVSSAVYVSGQNGANVADIMYVETHGGGNAIKGYSDQGGAAIIGYSHGNSGGSAGIYGLQDNVGSAGIFTIANPASLSAALKASTSGAGYSGIFTGGAGLQTDKIQITSLPVSGYVLTSDGSGNGTWQAPAGGLPAGLNGQIMYNDGTGWNGTSLTSMSFNGTQLGIGTASPSAYLEVQSPVQAANFVGSSNSTPVVNVQSSGGSTALNVSNLNGGTAATFQNNGSGTAPVVTVLNTGSGRSATFNGGTGVQVDNIYVGNILNVALNANPGWVLTSNAVGDAAWQPPMVPVGTFKQMLFNNGANWIPTAVTNLSFDGTNMGIGTGTPSTLLDVNSNNGSGAVNITHGASGGAALSINATAVANSNSALKVTTSSSAGFSGKFSGGSGLSTDKMQISAGANPDAVLISSNINGDAVWAMPINFSTDGGSTTATNGTATSIAFGTVNYCNPSGAVSAGTYTVPVNGLYHFDGAAAFNITTGLPAASDFVLRVLINGGIYRETIVHLPTGYTGAVQNTISVDAQLATGQTVRLAFFQSSGQSLNTVGGASENYFNGHLVR